MGYRHRLSVHEWPLYRCQPQKIYISQSLQISLNSEKVGFSPLGDLMWNGAVDNQKQLWSQLQQGRCIPMHSTSFSSQFFWKRIGCSGFKAKIPEYSRTSKHSIASISGRQKILKSYSVGLLCDESFWHFDLNQYRFLTEPSLNKWMFMIVIFWFTTMSMHLLSFPKTNFIPFSWKAVHLLKLHNSITNNSQKSPNLKPQFFTVISKNAKIQEFHYFRNLQNLIKILWLTSNIKVCVLNIRFRKSSWNLCISFL